ncbi:hypothetical protein Q5752_000686 [Cryptotrichosporon argae]
MPFLPISDCCLKGSVLPGTPRGTLEPVSPSVRVARYAVKPAAPTGAHARAALVVFYDVFGFQIPNAKIMADAFADKLDVDVYVPDYIPGAPPPALLDPALEAFPGQHAQQSWIASITGKLGLVRALPYYGAIRDAAVHPLVERAVEDLRAQGYTRVVAVGYCRGGSMITHLLEAGDKALLDAAVIVHPGLEPKRWPQITKPTRWLLAGNDHFFTPAKIDDLKAAFDGRPVEFDVAVYADTNHGFAARPAMEHEPTRKAFHEANDAAVDFISRHL